jgi:hypothetical protein
MIILRLSSKIFIMKKAIKITFSYSTFFICMLLFTSSCKKELPELNVNSSSGYYMRFKVNAVAKEYKIDCVGKLNDFQTNPDVYASTFFGAKDQTSPNKNGLAITMFTVPESLLNTTYTNYATTSPSLTAARDLIIMYRDENGEQYDSVIEIALPYLPSGLVCTNQLRIYEANAVSLKGTFSGTLYSIDYSKKIEITNGEFYVKKGA